MAFSVTELKSEQFNIPAGWRIVKVRDVAKINELCIQKNYPHDWIEYIDIASVEKGTIKSVQELPLREAPSRAKRIVQDNDTLIATVRPNLEHYAFIKKSKPSTVASTGFAVVSAKHVEPRFLYFYLTIKPFTNYLARIADSHTSAYPSFNPDVIENAELILPREKEQKAIALILGTLDDKIELNRKMSETLEAMARATFKSWFVDFDPIPGFGSHKEWEDSELGKIPKEWRVGTISDILELSRNSINPLNFPDETFNHFSIPAYDDGQSPNIEEGEAIKSNKFLLLKKCILLSKLNPRIPRIWFPRINKNRRSVASTEFLVLIQKAAYTCEFIYSLCTSTIFQDTYASLVTGTSGSHQRVKPEDLLSIKVVLPAEDALNVFSKKTGSLFEEIKYNKEQSLTLATIRDALLPKLLSGEIRVKDAEKFVEVAL